VAQIASVVWIAHSRRAGGRSEGESLVSGTRTAMSKTSAASTSSILYGAEAESRIAWVSKALCRAADPDELFVRGAAQRKAAVICRHCPVMLECGADALDNRVEFGVWGGMTERQRRALLKQHPEVVSWSEFFAAQRKHRSVG
jgi:WhiB family transcriptional regulator, redox-sensing transcriptional regulator